MKRSEAFPTKFLSKDDIHAPVVGVIETVVKETLGQGDDQELKNVMYFSSGIPKPMVINATNWINVEAAYGDESDAWAGKQIEVWVDPSVSFGGKRIGGLRLRAPASAKAIKAAPAANGSALWKRWYEIVAQAGELGVPVVELDNGANDDEIIAAGKALAAQVKAATTVRMEPF